MTDEHLLGSSPLTRGKLDKVRGHQGHGGLIPAHAGKTSPGLTGASPPRAHPRSRGENHLGQSHRRNVQGLIPAHAGKTSPSRTATFRLRAHPRSRGENTANRGEKVAGAGSSPLTRGKRFFRARLRVLSGLIPAHAGKTSVALTQFKLSGAHPRSRGENAEGSTHCAVARGSSPLTRGKPATASSSQ